MANPDDISDGTPKDVASDRAESPDRHHSWAEAMVGKRFASFLIEEVAGRGGMGVVFKARERFTRNWVALKVFPALTRRDREPVRRFLSEARVLTRLHHPAIPRIRAMGREEHFYYLATDYVEGFTVAQFIDAGRTFTPRRAMEIAREVGGALRAAHDHGVLHRDVKSDNIMIDEHDQVKVLDFGIAQDLHALRRITRGEIYLGTPEYCSPEQLCSMETDERTDIYSLGIVLHEMLTGRMPFRGSGTVELYREKRRNRRPALSRLVPGAPRPLVRLMNGLLASNPNRRFATMEDAVRTIDEVIPKLGAFGWGHHGAKRFARRRTSSRRSRLIPEAITSLFF
jgi:serine/threonine-protein kinase